MTRRLVSRARAAAAALVLLLVSAGVLGVRSAGLLESPELGAYDWCLRLRPAAASGAADPRIVLVTISDADIAGQGRWPLPDGTLAVIVETLAAAGAAAIGLDIYRDVPVPPGTADFEAALRAHPNVVAAMKFPEGNAPGIGPPPVVRGTSQVGFTDVVVDPGGIVRRGLLFLEQDGESVASLGLQLALLYLERKGVRPEAGPRGELRLGGISLPPLEGNDGAYVRADARGYQILLDFAGAQSGFPTVALRDLLDARVPPETFRDRVVLVGIAAEGVPDYFYTPFSRGLGAGQYLYGVALHAHLVSQIIRTGLDGVPPIATAGQTWEAAWIVLWAALGAVLGLTVRSPWRFSLLVIAGLGVVSLLVLGAFVARWWLPLVPPAITWVAAAAVVTAYVSYREAVQRSVTMQLFSTHVSREVAEAIWRQRQDFLDGRRPRPQRLTATVLFTDLVGFTTLSERLPPSVLVDWLNEYIDAMANEVMNHGGVVNKYIGDAIMALFGVPVARSTEEEVARDAAAAVACALAMRARLLELNQRWAREQRPTARMRVGITTGPLVAGSLGSARRLEYTVIGDTVNTASRLESFDKDEAWPDPVAEPCRILIGESTRHHLGPDVMTEPVGTVSLKGKEHAVKVYRVVPSAPQPSVGVDNPSPRHV